MKYYPEIKTRCAVHTVSDDRRVPVSFPTIFDAKAWIVRTLKYEYAERVEKFEKCVDEQTKAHETPFNDDLLQKIVEDRHRGRVKRAAQFLRKTIHRIDFLLVRGFKVVPVRGDSYETLGDVPSEVDFPRIRDMRSRVNQTLSSLLETKT